MNKYFLNFTYCFVLFLVFTGCKGVEFFKKPEQDRIQKIQEKEFSELKDYLIQIGTLPVLNTKILNDKTLSRTKGNVEYRFDEEEGKAGYYIPYEIEKEYTGIELIKELSPVSSSGLIWPGNLLQGGSIRSGNLVEIPLANKRKGGRIRLDVVSGQKDMKYFREIDEFSGSNLIQAMNDMLASYSYGLPADVSYYKNTVHSTEEMAYYLNQSPEDFSALTNGGFNSIPWGDKKTRIMVKLRQVYFTISYDSPEWSEFFKSATKQEDLAPYTGKDNPPCYISSVSYGRYYILLYESNIRSEAVLSNIIDKVYNENNKENLTDNEKRIFKNAKVVLRQVGGDAQSGLETISGDFDKLKKFVLDGALFSKDNIGAPISYTANYLMTNLPVPVYKKLDVKVKKTVYEPEEKNNNVLIEIKQISSAPLQLDGGKSRLVNKSNFSVGDISVSVYKKGKLEKGPFIFKPNLQKIGAENYSTQRGYNYVFDIGELGKYPTEKIILEFPVHYQIHRYASSFFKNRLDKQDRWYKKRVEFSFDEKSRKWRISHTDSSDNNFRNLVIKDSFNSCHLNFKLEYIFKADRETY